MRFAAVTIGVVALLCVSCISEDMSGDRPTSSTVRDSSGVQIVESHRPEWDSGEGWQLSDLPTVSIGLESGPSEYLLHNVAAATRLTDGRIVVAENGTSSLRFYDSSGVYMKSVGRAGQGPGEFARIMSLFAIRGDTLMVSDNRNSLVMFDSNGQLVRHQNISANDWQVLSFEGAFADGTLLRRLGGEGYKPPSEAALDSVPFQTLDRIGKVQSAFSFYGPRRDVTKFAGTPTYAAVMGRGPRPVLETLYALQTSTHHAVGPTQFFYGDSRRFEILVASPQGALLRIMRVTAPLEPIPASVKTDSATYSFASATYRANQVIWPDSYPPFRRLLADRAGNLWASNVRRAGESMDTTRFTVFSAAGVLLGEVQVPSSMQILEIGADYLLGLERNGADVESVRLYRLRK